MMDGIIFINKKQNMTSFDVLRILKRKYQVKLGHSGTLDPNATGLLMVAINKATKALNFMEASDKVYTATCQLGLKTDTGDIWGETIQKQTPRVIESHKLKEALEFFTKRQRQRVPMVSAKKINGKKLLEYHREKIPVETQYTDIEVYDIELINFNDDTFTIKAHVSNGTYMRTLCEDIAEYIGEIGTMSALERSSIGRFTLSDALDLDYLPEELDPIPTKDVIALKRIEDKALAQQVSWGQRIQLDVEDDLVLVDTGEYFAVYEREESNIFKSKRGLW